MANTEIYAVEDSTYKYIQQLNYCSGFKTDKKPQTNSNKKNRPQKK